MKQLLSIMMVAAAATASAEVLTPAQALERALGAAPAGVKKAASMQKGAKLKPALTIGETADAPELYVMTPTDGSLIIVSAESETPALLGYSDNAGFDPTNIPPAMNAMLNTFAYEIKAARAGIATAATGGRADMPAILPLCKTTWNQDAPYNLYCPKMDGKASMTGCVATAMAQVLKVLEWPKQCNGGTETYYWDNGKQNLTLNFDDVTLNWASMRDHYTGSGTTVSSKATASLMQAVAYAGHMNFSPSASGTHGITMATGLIKHFDYDCTLSYEQHEWYTQADWEGLIHHELSVGTPVYCDGVTGDYSAGHAFVIDGYAGDGFFHLNWGWGGMSDGYYRLTALDPSAQGIGGSTSGYNFAQGIIVGLKRGATTPLSESPLVFQCYNTFGTSTQNVTKGRSATFSGGFYNMSPLTVSKVTPGVRFINENTGEELEYRSSSPINNELPPSNGFLQYNVAMPTSIPEGTYTVHPTIYDRTNKITYEMRSRIGGYGYLIAKVTSTSVVFSEPVRSSIKASDVRLTSEAYVNTPFSVSATISNQTEQPYNGYVTPAIFNINTATAVKVFEPIAIELNAGESQELNIMCGLDKNITTGSYDFALMTENGSMAGPSVRFSVNAHLGTGIMKCDNLKVINTALNNLTFELTATCTEGYYSNPLYVVIFRRSGTGNYLDYFMSEPTLISAGEQKTVTISSTFSSGSPNTIYTARAYYINSQAGSNMPMVDSATVQFTLTDGEYGESNAVEIVSGESETEWIDLQGRHISSPARGSIVIRKQGDKIEKVRL